MGMGRDARRDVWVDRFRPVAAAMVVAIHTAPLAEVSPMLDEAMVYGIFRVAVPFFLMVAGRYVLAPFLKRLPESRERMRRYVRRTVATYLFATAAYLPLMAYAGNIPTSAPAFLRWLLVDGAVYHLWYFPALVFGLAVCRALSRLGSRAAMAAATALYLAGVGGDSYFGAVGAAGPLEPLYGALFSCVGFTRNGLFYVPLFLMLGAVSRPAEEGLMKRDGALLAVSLFAVATEACLTSALGWQRHDSMYLSLPLASWALFRLLLSARPRAWRPLDTAASASEAVYLVHPYAIVAVRGAARLVPGVASPAPLFAATLALSFVTAMVASRAKSAICAAVARVRDKGAEAKHREHGRKEHGTE